MYVDNLYRYHMLDVISSDNPPPIAINIPEQDPSSSALVSQCKRKTTNPKSADPKSANPKPFQSSLIPKHPPLCPQPKQSLSSVPLIRKTSSKPPSSQLSAEANHLHSAIPFIFNQCNQFQAIPIYLCLLQGCPTPTSNHYQCSLGCY